MKQIDFEYGGKHCQLIIFDKYKYKLRNNEVNRLKKLVNVYEIDVHSFDIINNIHSGFPESIFEYQFMERLDNEVNKINLDIDEIKKLTKEVYMKYNNQFLCNFLRIFIYPLEMDNQPDLNGVHAYGPYKNTIHFWINPNRKNWKKVFQETIFHEQSHAYLHTTNKNYVEHFIKEGPLYEWIISEGLAENYAESVTGGYNFKQGNKWFGFSKESALDQFKLIKNRIYESREDDGNIMFGGGKYKRLTGYAIGYWIVNDYLKNTKKSIVEAHHATFKDILEGSGWLN